jgi:FAD/FMN-containing dehydrogenase
MILKEKLVEVVGVKNVIDDGKTRERYSRDQSFVHTCKPDAIVRPKNVEEVQEIIRVANEERTPVIPYSSGLNLRGATIPDQGGIILDLSRMDKVETIDEKNRLAVIEPGVTFVKLQEELTSRRHRAMVPLGVPAERSVLSSYMERDPVGAAASFEYGNDLFLDMEIVLPTGEILRTGNWSAGGNAGCAWGPSGQLNYRFWTGAQGTLGVVTKLALKIEPMPKVRKVFFLDFDSLEKAVATVRKIQKREIGLECFGLNACNLAAILERGWTTPGSFPCEKEQPSDFEILRKRLPPWMFTICISGLDYFPEDKVSYEEAALREVCAEDNVELLITVAGLSGLEEIFLDLLIHPWQRTLRKFRYKGTCQNIAFYSPFAKAPMYEGIIREIGEKYGYSQRDIMGYVLPIERGRAAYCEFDFPCDLENKAETELVKRVWREASKALMDKGAYFDRPYGIWADMVYSRYNTPYVSRLKRIKKEIDPNDIMNPGKLCF